MKAKLILGVVAMVAWTVPAWATLSASMSSPGYVATNQSYSVSASASDDFGELISLTITKNGQYVSASYGSGWGTYSLSTSASQTAPGSGTTLTYLAWADSNSYSASQSTTTYVVAPPTVTDIASSIGTVYPGDTFKGRVTATHSGGSLASIHIFLGGSPSNYNDYTYANAFVAASGSSSTVDGNAITAGNAGTNYTFYAMAEATSNIYSSVYGPVTITVQKRNQATLTLNASTSQTYATNQTLTTTGGSGGGAVTYAIVNQSAAGVATLSGTTLTANTGTGWVDVQATKAAETNYNATTSATVRVTFTKANQGTVTFSPSTSQTYNTTQTLSAGGGSGSGGYSYAVTNHSAAGVETLSGASLTANTGTGWVDVQATRAGDANYNAANSSVVRITFVKAGPTALILNASTTQTYNTSQTLSTSGGSGGGSVSYAVTARSATGVESLSGSTLTANTGTGWVDVQATKAADTNYNAGSSSVVRVTFATAAQGALTLVASTSQTYNTSQTLSTSGGSGTGSVSYAVTARSAAGVETLSGSTLTANAGTGWVDLQATKAADANYSSATSTTVRITFAKANQSAITFSPAPSMAYNSSQTLTASGGSGSGSFAYAKIAESSAGVATLSGATLTANAGSGWVDVQATRASDSDYNAATSSTVRISFATASQATLTFAPTATQTFNTTQTLTTSGGSGSGAVTYVIVNRSAAGVGSLSSNVLTANTGTGWADVQATKAGDGYYAAASSTARVTFAKASQAALVFSPATPQTYNTSQMLATTGGSGTGGVSFAVTGQSTSGVVTLTGTTLAANSGTGWADVQATKAGDNDYNSASTTARVNLAKASQTVSVSPGAATVLQGGSTGFAATGGATSYTWGGSSGASGSGSTKTVTFGATGTCTVTVQASADTNYSASNTATATVTVLDPAADANGDGLTNAEEIALNLDPLATRSSGNLHLNVHRPQN